MIKQSTRQHTRLSGLILLALAVIVGLVFVSSYNFLLFHTLAESLATMIAGAVFIIAWNTWEMTEHGYLKFLGVALFFTGTMDLVHTLAYKGMGVFPGYDANLPTQLWIATRYVQAFSLLIAPAFLYRNINRSDRNLLTGAYTLITASLLAWIFTGGFPDCYIEGQGLTQFKIVSEYIIGLLLVGAVWRLSRHRNAFDRGIFQWLIVSILFTIVSELAFTFYVSVYGLSNLVGHIFKILAFFGFYRAIVRTTLHQPYALLFRDLQQRNEQLTQEIAERRQVEETLRHERDRAQHYLDVAGVMLISLDTQGRVTLINAEGCEILGYAEDKIIGQDWFETFLPPSIVKDVREVFDQIMNDEIEHVEYYENPIIRKDGSRRFIGWRNSVLRDKEGKVVGLLSSGNDITERREAEEVAQAATQQLEVFLEHAPVLVIIFDREGRYLRVNSAAADLFQMSRADIEGKTFADVLPPDVAKSFYDRLDTLLETRAPMNVQNTMVVEGNERVLQSILFPLSDDGEPQTFGSIAWDITERLRMQNQLHQQERLAAVGQLGLGSPTTSGTSLLQSCFTRN